MINRGFTDDNEVLVAVTPQSITGDATVASSYFALAPGRSMTFIVQVGTLAADVDVVVNEATDGSGTGAQAITGKLGTFTYSATPADDQSDTVGIIEVIGSELSDGFTYVAVAITPDTENAIANAVAVRGNNYSNPQTNTDAAFNVKPYNV